MTEFQNGINSQSLIESEYFNANVMIKTRILHAIQVSPGENSSGVLSTGT